MILILGYFASSDSSLEVDGPSIAGFQSSILLTGRAFEAFCRHSENEATDYDHVKEVLHKKYNLSKDGMARCH